MTAIDKYRTQQPASQNIPFFRVHVFSVRFFDFRFIWLKRVASIDFLKSYEKLMHFFISLHFGHFIGGNNTMKWNRIKISSVGYEGFFFGWWSHTGLITIVHRLRTHSSSTNLL